MNVPMYRVGIWQVGVTGTPDPARVGDNTITVAASDSSNRPLRGSVEVVVSMAAMGAMPYMESRGKVRPVGAGMFRATYGLPMGGEWDVAVRLHPEQGAPAEAEEARRLHAFAAGRLERFANLIALRRLDREIELGRERGRRRRHGRRRERGGFGRDAEELHREVFG